MRNILLIIFTLTFASASFADEFDSYYSLASERDVLLAERNAKHKKLLRQGVTDKKAHAKLDEICNRKAKILEIKRSEALKTICRKAGVKSLKRSGLAVRGILGDIDTMNTSKKDVAKIIDTINKHNASVANGKNPQGQIYTISDHPGYTQIKELDTTIFKKFDNPEKFIFTRGAGKETALSYRLTSKGKNDNLKSRVVRDGKVVAVKLKEFPPVIVDKDIYNLDNLKKIGADFAKTNVKDIDLQNLGKGTMRILENTYGKNLKMVSDPARKRKLAKLLVECRALKVYSAESAGLHSRGLKQDFVDKARRAVVEAYHVQSRKSEKKLRTDLEKSYKELDTLKQKLKSSKGENRLLRVEYETRKKFFAKESKSLHEYRKMRLAAKRGVIRNGGTELLAECEGKKVKRRKLARGGVVFETPNGTLISNSGMEERLIKLDRKKVKMVESGLPVEHSSSSLDHHPTIGSNIKLQSAVNFADSAVGAWQTGKTLESYLPEDMDTSTKSGIRMLTSTLALHPLIQGATQSVIGGGQEGFDEMVKWFKQHPDREPTQWELTKIGLRGGNTFAKKLLKGTVYGVTLKPLHDIYDIGHGLGDTIKQTRNAEAAAKIATAKAEEVSKAYKKKLNAMKAYLNQAESMTAKVKNDPLTFPSERKAAGGVDSNIRTARTMVSLASQTLDSEMRDVTTSSERGRSLAHCAPLLRAVDKSLRKLLNSRSKCAVKLILVDAVSGTPIETATRVDWRCGKDSSNKRGRGGSTIWNIPPGRCSLKVYATDYLSSKQLTVDLDFRRKGRRLVSLKIALYPRNAVITLEMFRKAVPYAQKTYLKDLGTSADKLINAADTTIKLLRQTDDLSAEALDRIENTLLNIQKQMKQQTVKCAEATTALSVLLGRKVLSPKAEKYPDASALINSAKQIVPVLNNVSSAYEKKLSTIKKVLVVVRKYKKIQIGKIAAKNGKKKTTPPEVNDKKLEPPSRFKSNSNFYVRKDFSISVAQLKQRLSFPGYTTKARYSGRRGEEKWKSFEEIEIYGFRGSDIIATCTYTIIGYAFNKSPDDSWSNTIKAMRNEMIIQAGLSRRTNKLKRWESGEIEFIKDVGPKRKYNQYNSKKRTYFKAVNGGDTLFICHKNAVIRIRRRLMGVPEDEPDIMPEIVKRVIALFN